MKMKMTKEQFIESMQEAKEGEKSSKSAADIPGEVKQAVEKGTGTNITRLSEPIYIYKPQKKRGRKPGKTQETHSELWKDHLNSVITFMAAEGADKIAEAGALIEKAEALIEEAEELMTRIEALKEMMK